LRHELPPTWRPQPGPQEILINCPYPEVLFGGARGGGKTDACLGKLAIAALRYRAAFNGLFIRQTMPQADDLIARAQEIYTSLGAKWLEQKKMFTFPGNGRLRFRAMENLADAERFQGQNITHIVVEEAGNWASSAPIDRLFGCLRSAAGVPVQLILTANPGGVGHGWIKQRYIDPAPEGLRKITRTLPSGRTHIAIYIPSRVTSNLILLSKDPAYLDRLSLVGSPQLVKAWTFGDWNVVEGSFFPEFGDQHIVTPFPIPPAWTRFRSLDWGSASPYAILWFAVASEDFMLKNLMHEHKTIPRQALVVYRELYGSKDHSNTGVKEPAEIVAQRIHSLERYEPRRPDGSGIAHIAYSVIDPAAAASDGGPSIKERLSKAGIYCRDADNRRVGERGAMGGWDLVRARLIGDGVLPDLYVFSTCVDFVRTFPLLQHDPARPEDVLKYGEDHLADALRYGVTSRPFIRHVAPPKGALRPLNTMTLDELWTEHERSGSVRL
jgi:hypothetical protein